MFADFKLIADLAVKAYKALAGQQQSEWKQLGALFEKISVTLKNMAEKYSSGTVPIEEFIEVQVYADELRSCWGNLPLSGKSAEVQKWNSLLDHAITTAEGTDAKYFGFRSVPGPFYSRKEKRVSRQDDGAEMPAPSVQEIREVAAAFHAAAVIFSGRAA